MYFEGQGKLEVAEAIDGVPGRFRWVADVNALDLSPSADSESWQENYTGERNTAGRIAKARSLNVSFSMREWIADNLAMALYGQHTTIANGTVTAEALTANLVQGDIARLAYPQVSTVVINDSASTPVALVAGTDYEVDAAFGDITIIGDLISYTQPLTAAYSYQGGDNVTMFSANSKERWLRFKGLNTADDQKPVLVELYRVMLDPTDSAALISDQIANLSMSGGALYDQVNADNTELGGFGRIIHVAPAAP